MPLSPVRSRSGCALGAALLFFPAALLCARPARAQAGPPDASDTAPPPPPDDYDEGSPAPPEVQPPAQPPDQRTFETSLSSYGSWVDTPDYGRVWVPAAAANRAWQPYTDGSWVYTDAGWAFSSDVPWGWAVFHYGRWGWRDGPGWFWVPGYTWAPAWVSWRYSGGHVAWSPYGPRGFNYGGRWHGWVAMPAQHFTHPIAHEMLPRAHVGPIVRGARPAPSIQAGPVRGHVYGPPRGVVGTSRPGRGAGPGAAPRGGQPPRGGQGSPGGHAPQGGHGSPGGHPQGGHRGGER